MTHSYGGFPQPDEGFELTPEWLAQNRSITFPSPDDPTPDLSLVRGEWYFTDSTARALADLVGDSLLAVGTPTVAREATRRSPQRHVELVDSSPWLPQRVGPMPGVVFHWMDFTEFSTDERFDTIIFDPPWYEPMLTSWMIHCAALLRPGGKLVFPLLAPNTRPTAVRERNQLMALASSIGHLSVVPESITYDVPRYERCALWARGVAQISPWRHADMAEVIVQTPPGSRTTSGPTPSDWFEYQIGQQLVAVRNRPFAPRPTSDRLLEQVPGVSGTTLDSVSRRDPRWPDVDVWFSSNRVARCTNLDRLHSVLRDLGQPENPRRGYLAGAANGADATELRRWLDD